jgi:streptogramin lyase
MRFSPWVLLLGCFVPLVLTGCSIESSYAPTADAGLAIQGTVHGGQQGIVGAHVYLLAANAGVFTPNTNGYGNASLSLLKAGTGTLLDQSGGATNNFYYVLTGAGGAFSISSDYSCTPNTQVYLYAVGGNPGSGANSAAGLMAALGNCPSAGNFLAATPFINMNEVTTVAAAYAMAGFATDAVHVSSSGTPLALTGIANAFLNATSLADLPSGTALATTPNFWGTPPQAEINTLGNILAACVNSTGSTSPSCNTLFANAKSGGSTGTMATDTATAAINIAHNPVATVAALYGLATTNPPFAPALTTQPNDFSVTIQYTNGGGTIAVDSAGDIWWGAGLVDKINSLGADLTGGTGYYNIGGVVNPVAVAIDLNQNLWTVNFNTVSELTNSGTAVSPSTGFTGLGITQPSSLALDASGNMWIGDSYTQTAIKVSSSGTLLGSDSGDGLSSPEGVAIDPSGNAWIADLSNAIVEISSAGVPLSGTTGYTGGGLSLPVGIAIDHSGNVWVANSGGSSVTAISSTGSALAGSPYTGNSLAGANTIAIDGAGNVWASGTSAITELSNTGTFLSGSNGFLVSLGASGGIAIDGSGDVWTNYFYYNSLLSQTTDYTYEMIGAAAPVVTPLVQAVKNNALGTRP